MLSVELKCERHRFLQKGRVLRVTELNISLPLYTIVNILSMTSVHFTRLIRGTI